jgi:hypothetical protein
MFLQPIFFSKEYEKEEESIFDNGNLMESKEEESNFNNGNPMEPFSQEFLEFVDIEPNLNSYPLKENKIKNEINTTSKFKTACNSNDQNMNNEEKKENKDNNLKFEIFTSKEIKEIFENKLKDKNFKENKICQTPINVIECIGKKRYRRTNEEIKLAEKNQEIKEEVKQGRIQNNSKENISEKSHNKFSVDNIMKKVKKNLINYLILFIKSLLPEEYQQYSLFKINYKIIDNLKKDINLKYLKMTLKEFLSQEISPKYINKDEKTNKNNIDAILKIKIAFENKEVINQIFNMTLGEWIDIFTMKKQSNINGSGIDKFLKKLLKDIYKNNETNNEVDYFSTFVYCLYNYGRWFDCKKGRKGRKSCPKNTKEN